jgi:hypothetical protein
MAVVVLLAAGGGESKSHQSPIQHGGIISVDLLFVRAKECKF